MNQTCRFLPATLCAVAGVVGAGIVSSPARAQYMGSGGRMFNNVYGAMLDNSISNNITNLRLERQRKELLDSLHKGMKPGAPAPPSPLLFKRTDSPLVVDSLANAWGDTPTAKKQLAKAFREGIEAVRTEFGKIPNDSNPDDVAKAYTFYVSANYTILHPGFTLSDAGSVNLLHEFRTVLEASGNTAKAPDKDKQGLWETLVVMGIYITVQNERAKTDKDENSRKACAAVAGEALKTLLAVAPERLLLSEGEYPLSILPEVTTAKLDARGELHAAWMAFPAPSGWKAEQVENGLVLTPDGLKPGETVKVAIVPAKPGQVSFTSQAYIARGLLGPAAEFSGEFVTGNLANGWNYYAQPLTIKPSGTAMLLILSTTKNQLIQVITMGNNVAAVNRAYATISDQVGKKGRIAP